MSDHEVYMRRCIELAQKGQGSVSPNPMVGAVVVYHHQIVAEGWHQVFGGPHAEPNALALLPSGVPLHDCTLYVNLEPCSHFGKTPPCSRLLIDKNIGKVVIGSTDPNPKVNGRGIALLREAGISVETGILKDQCDALNKRFFTYQNLKRPYIVLKWACSNDGFMAPANRERVQISGEEARVMLHRWRAEEDAILIGATTAIMDKPLLDTRLAPGKNPLRVVLDPNLRAPQLPGDFQTLIMNTRLGKNEGNFEWIKMRQDFAVADVLEILYNRQLLSLMVEGGAETLHRFLASGFVDEIRVIRSKKLRMQTGVEGPKISMPLIKSEETNDDTIEYYGKEIVTCG